MKRELKISWGGRTGLLYIFCLLAIILLPLSSSGQTTPAKKTRPAHNRTVQQQLSLEERLEAEQRLQALGYWTGPVDGVMDAGSYHALIAFQKVAGRKPTGRLTTEDLQLLRNALRPHPLQGGNQHIEVDLTRQVLFMVDEKGIVSRILPISSGNEKLYEQDGAWHRAHTPSGSFTVYRKINGWRRSPLGLLYYPNYLIKGIAIHGNPSVPVYPASHGCIRIPMYAAKEFSELTPVGTMVIVFDKTMLLAKPADSGE